LVLRLSLLVVYAVLLLSATLAVAQEAPAPADVLTLDQAIALAQENNRLIKISYQKVLQATDQILAARTQRYPHFNIQLTGSYLLTAVHVNFPQGAFGFVNNTPVPDTNSVLTTQPLCYAQIGGLGVATFITLLLVPVLYSIFVLDLKLVNWAAPVSGSETSTHDTKGEPR